MQFLRQKEISNSLERYQTTEYIWQYVAFTYQGGFHLKFASINQVINHMTFFKFKCSHWWKICLKKKCLQDLLFSLNAVISTNEITEFITGHVTYNLDYTYKFQL